MERVFVCSHDQRVNGVLGLQFAVYICDGDLYVFEELESFMKTRFISIEL
jgi:hypothetical protein